MEEATSGTATEAMGAARATNVVRNARACKVRVRANMVSMLLVKEGQQCKCDALVKGACQVWNGRSCVKYGMKNENALSGVQWLVG